jgi:hypothetical protein
MDYSNEEQPSRPTGTPPRLPKIWVGYLLGLATSTAEVVAVTLHPELLQGKLVMPPPLYLFLANFISLVYWLVCVYEYHVVIAYLSGGTYPIKPSRAAWFHLIPIYGFYWAYKWPREFAVFVNDRSQSVVMKPERTGWMTFVAFVFFVLFARGLGMVFLFWVASYLSAGLRRALESPPVASS